MGELETYKVIDNFLPSLLFNEIKSTIVFNISFPLFISTGVVVEDSEEYSLNKNSWNYYFVHLLYYDHKPYSQFYEELSSRFLPSLYEKCDLKSLMRMKINYYPHTETLREHGKHQDDTYSHKAAVFSLNTCDGFTRMEDGTKIDSVENRLLIFDGMSFHNSSTTTNTKGRYNINLNFL